MRSTLDEFSVNGGSEARDQNSIVMANVQYRRNDPRQSPITFTETLHDVRLCGKKVQHEWHRMT
jgi:hypothetical protein